MVGKRLGAWGQVRAGGNPGAEGLRGNAEGGISAGREGLNSDVALMLPNEVEINDKRQVVSSWKGMYFIRPSEKGRLVLSLLEGPLGKKSISFFSVSFGLYSASPAADAGAGTQYVDEVAAK